MFLVRHQATVDDLNFQTRHSNGHPVRCPTVGGISSIAKFLRFVSTSTLGKGSHERTVLKIVAQEFDVWNHTWSAKKGQLLVQNGLDWMYLQPPLWTHACFLLLVGTKKFGALTVLASIREPKGQWERPGSRKTPRKERTARRGTCNPTWCSPRSLQNQARQVSRTRADGSLTYPSSRAESLPNTSMLFQFGDVVLVMAHPEFADLPFVFCALSILYVYPGGRQCSVRQCQS